MSEPRLGEWQLRWRIPRLARAYGNDDDPAKAEIHAETRPPRRYSCTMPPSDPAPRPLSAATALALLEWQIAMGADEAIDAAAPDRFAAAPVAPVPSPPLQ